EIVTVPQSTLVICTVSVILVPGPGLLRVISIELLFGKVLIKKVLFAVQIYVAPAMAGTLKVPLSQIASGPVMDKPQKALQLTIGGLGGGLPTCVSSCANQSPFLGKKPVCCSLLL